MRSQAEAAVRLALGHADDGADARQPVADDLLETAALGAVVVGLDVHRRAELALVRQQRRQLGVGEAGDVLDVVGLVGLEQQQVVGPVVRQVVVPVEVRVARRHATVDGEPAGVAVVGVQPFGGEGLSGTGPKAGGPHYVARFATERVRTTDITASGGNTALLSLDAPDEGAG